MSREPLPDCQDITFSAISARVEDMATRRANCAVGDGRAGKPLELHLMLTDLIHHETRSAYLAGYLQAGKDFLLQRKDATLEKKCLPMNNKPW